MKDNTNNKEFWNNYVTYWENKVEQANEEKNAADRTSDDKNLETYFRKLDVTKKDKFLDFGCGSCRLFPIYLNVVGEDSQNYIGIDISGVSLEHAERKYSKLGLNKNLIEFDGIHIPFGNETFDKIMCFGVFDACSQEETMKELLRILKKDGLILLTGKNNEYFTDDKEALIAEINARKKNHPNSFTDVHKLKKQLKNYGTDIVEEFYFLRRGDFPKNSFTKKIPKKFYEWALVIKKNRINNYYEFEKFSNCYSAVNK